MANTQSRCPCCGAPCSPSQTQCGVCGSYILWPTDKFLEFPENTFPLQQKRPDLYPGIYVFGRLLGQGEKPLAIGEANYFTDVVSAGGKLLLTKRALYFSAHKLNAGRKEAVIPLDTVCSAQVVCNLLVSQHIEITTPYERHKFVVYSGKKWIQESQNAIGELQDRG